jgi:hypothetical protein
MPSEVIDPLKLLLLYISILSVFFAITFCDSRLRSNREFNIPFCPLARIYFRAKESLSLAVLCALCV